MKLKINFGLVILSIVVIIIFVEFAYFLYKEYGTTKIKEIKDRMLRSNVEGFDSAVQQKPVIDDSNIPDVKFPFKNCRDENGKKLNIIMISAPFRTTEDEESYAKYKQQGLGFCGISS